MTESVDIPLQGQFGPPDDSPEYAIQRLRKLSDQHKLAAHLRIGGKSITQIAAHLGWTSSYVSRICSDPLFLTYKLQIEKDFAEAAKDRLADLVAGASSDTFNIINDIMHSADATNSTRLRAAQMLFDRQLPAVQRIEQENTTTINIEGLSDIFKDMHDVFATRIPKKILDMPAEDQLMFMDKLMEENPKDDMPE